jgi:hypothetical protein
MALLVVRCAGEGRRVKRRLPKLGKKRSGLEHSVTAGLAAAERAAAARKGAPDESDAPPVSTFPMTPAAKEALRSSVPARGDTRQQT